MVLCFIVCIGRIVKNGIYTTTNPDDMHMIRAAGESEAVTLSKLSFKSKGYWDYPDKYFEIWSKELTISREYIHHNDVFVFVDGDNVLGYYSIVELRKD